MKFAFFVFSSRASFQTRALTIGSGYFSELTSKFKKSCGPATLTKFPRIQFYHIFQTFLQRFCVNTTRRDFGNVSHHATDLSQHEPLRGATVHENTVCVTYGAPRFGVNFRVSSRCSKYATISNTSGTPVHQTTVCVTSGARRRSVPLSFLDRNLAIWAAKAAQDSRTVPAGEHLGCQCRPGMLPGPYFGTPAATAEPSVGYLPQAGAPCT